MGGRRRAGLLQGIFWLIGFSGAMAADQKIPLKPSMVTNEAAVGDAGQLVDEQDIAGDPATGKGGTPKTSWSLGWTAWRYPASAFIDLGTRCRISKIYLYDGQGTGQVVVSAGEPFQWNALFTDPLEHYLQWNEHPVQVETRYVRVTIGTPGTALPEIVIYGEPLGAPAAIPAEAPPPPQPTMDQFIGINAFIDDPLERIQVAGFVREYHNWNWDEGDGRTYAGYPHNAYKWNPSYAGGGWNFDAYYASLKKSNITVCPAIQGSVSWLTPGDLDNKPVLPGKNPEDPAAYAAHADHLFQYAARYGSARVPEGKLKLAPDQAPNTGMGLLHYFENWNEQDKSWKGRDAYFSPYEFAAMSSADYDGDQGRMGSTFGIRSADPNAKLVMGGLAGMNLDYIKAMKVWADFHRKGSFPADVINLHHYSNDGGDQGLGKVGISPEDDHLREKFQPFVDYRNRYLPGKEIWVTEFGYDTNPRSPQHAPAIGPYTAEEVQGQWIVRSYLALAAAGVDRAAMYMLRDVNPAGTTQFDSSGLVTEKGAWKPKPSWYYVYTLKNRLAGMRFAGEQASPAPGVLIYKFRNPAIKKGAYVVWSGTSTGQTVEHFSLAIPGNPGTVALVQLANGQQNGVETRLSPAQSRVSISVSERPVIVLVDGMV